MPAAIIRCFGSGVALLGLMTWAAPSAAFAQFSEVLTTDSGAPLKVIVRRDTALFSQPGGNRDAGARSTPAEQFQFFYVLPADTSGARQKNGYYLVATGPSRSAEAGWIPSEDVVEWSHRQA